MKFKHAFVGDLSNQLCLCAGTRDGAYSIIFGAAANISIKERRPVEISGVA